MDSKAREAGTGLTGELEKDLALFRGKMERCSDVEYHKFTLQSGKQGCLIYIEGMTDDTRLQTEVIDPLSRMESEQDLSGALEAAGNGGNPKDLTGGSAHSGQLRKETKLEQGIIALCKGETIALLDKCRLVLIVSLSKWEQRSVEEPASEPVIRGARDGFTESLRTNMTLIRRRLATPDLKVESLQAGILSKTDIVLVYLDSVVMPGLVDEVKQRIQRIEIDAVLESGYIEELICDNPFSVFPQVINTERPDRAVSGILEGKAVIIIDNTPFALMAPGLFVEMLQASEDYYQNYIFSTLTRFLRLVLAIGALVFPSIYIALTTFHQEMIPASLLLSIASSREAVPFPALIEAILMEAAFEGLREAGIRLPRPVGQAVSIVGALVIGQAAVQAGIVSATLVIVVSFTGIASFIFPIYSQGLAFRVMRFPMMIMAGSLGLYGIFLGLLILLIHLVKLRSFGVPYLAPVIPLQVDSLKDVFVRFPWWSMKERPIQTGKRNFRRMSGNLRPRPPKP
ncbi:spore germination protein [Fontibacillus sp. BL9]|uniref:spore germination protein n=1 Tax=Fontibacillus sp. BL9 TaxID=3389971 RepID=UPI00397BC9DD